MIKNVEVNIALPSNIVNLLEARYPYFTLDKIVEMLCFIESDSQRRFEEVLDNNGIVPVPYAAAPKVNSVRRS